MPEDVTINKELDIIEVYSYGNVTGEILDATVKQIKRIEKETGINKVLVDTTKQKSMPDTITLYEFANNLPRDFMYAIVISEKQSTKPEQDFFETVAHNRGFVVNEFTSKEEAIAWLKS